MAPERQWRRLPALLLAALPALIVLYLVLPPLILLLISTFKSSADSLPLEPGPITLANYIQVFSDPDTLIVLANSLIYALATVGISLTIGMALVWLIERTDLPAKEIVLALVLLPVAIPGMVKAIGWAMLANPNMGVLNSIARDLFGLVDRWGPLNIYSLGGIIFVSALSHVPSVTLMIAGAFRSFDPALEEAAQMSGAEWRQTQRLVTMPLLKPSLLAAFVYFFAAGLDDFQIPAILGLNGNVHVFSTKIYLATNPARGLPDYGLASTYSIILLFIALMLILIYRRATRQSSRYAVITGKGYRPARVALGRWRYAAFAGVAIYLVLAAVLPLLTLLWVSLQPYFVAPSLEALARLSLTHYEHMVGTGQFQRALFNTLIIAPIVATATMLLATLIAWNGARGQVLGGVIPDMLTFVNLAVPTVVFGLAIMFVYLSAAVLHPVYGTIWILVIAFTTRFLTYATRLMGGAVIQIHKELEEASEIAGATRAQVFWRITLPLLRPSFLNGWLWVVVHALREATLAVMLMTPANIVLASMIWSQWREGVGYGPVAAMSIVVVGLTSGLALLSHLAFSAAEGRTASADTSRPAEGVRVTG
jgi:iron(III) transport system permease protein